MKRKQEIEKAVARVGMLLALVLSLVVGGYVGAAFADDTAVLFEPVTGAEAFSTSKGPLSGMTQLKVKVNFSAIEPTSVAKSLGTPLPDREVTLVRTESEERGKDDYTWFGSVSGHELSTVVLTVVDGVLTGNINMDGDDYTVELEGDSYVITKADPSLAVPLKEDFLVPPPMKKPSAPASQPAITPQAADSAGTIDVLVLYTQKMSSKYGSKLKSKIQSFIDLSNKIYKQSGVKTKLHLVGTKLYTNSSVKEPTNIDPALRHITSSSSVADLRNKYKADLVTLLRVWPQTTGTCGLGWMMMGGIYNLVGPQFAPYAFSVVEVKSASEGGSYCHDTTFPHELGHNMGCSHDRDHTSYQGAYKYSYGYDKSGVFATVMSYDYPRINYFSTPKIKYKGYPIGVDSNKSNAAYNVLTINNTRSIVANFKKRTTAAAFSASTKSGAGPLAVQFSDKSTGSIARWQWSFGDGATSTSKNPKHTYRKAGSYTVSLTVTGSGGSVKTTKKSYITVK